MATFEELQQTVGELERKLKTVSQDFEDMPRPFAKRFTNSLVSPNFVSGSSGWQIQENGDVEFNDGTFRGDLIIGVASGQRVEITNSGNTLDFYDDQNTLEAKMRALSVTTDGVNGFLLETVQGGGYEYLFSSAGFTMPGGTFTGDITLDNSSDPGGTNIVMSSPDSTLWIIAVDNSGNLTTTAI